MDMDILTLTNEYPPHVYGGAGVHVDHLVRALAGCDDGRHHVQVLCFGDQDETHPGISVTGVGPAGGLNGKPAHHRKVLDALSRNIVMAGSAEFVESPAALPAFQKAYGFTLTDDELLVLAGGNTAATIRAAMRR